MMSDIGKSEKSMHAPVVSIVIPVYNEAETIGALYTRLSAALAPETQPYEVLFINDGSTDASLALLEKIAAQDQRVRVVDLSRNFGQQIAITAGLHYSAGDAVVIMDADLQDPPEVIPAFLEKWRAGFEIVYAVRQKRKESLGKRFLYAAFYRILQRLAHIDIPLDSGDFGLIDGRVRDLINTMPESNRFIRGLRSWVGFRQTGIAYEREARFAGDSKQCFFQRLKLAQDSFVSFSILPLRLATIAGVCISGVSFLGLLLCLYRLFFAFPVPGFTTLIILGLFIAGIQLIAVGILGEYIGRIYDETKKRPLFVVRQTMNIDTSVQTAPNRL